MRLKFEKVIAYLKEWSKGHYTLAVILSILADLLVRAMIPGSGLVEVVIGLIVAAIVFINIAKDNARPGEGLIHSIHTSFQGV
jgi:uncharacterized membrane protein